jgi:Glyoxalase-like domain
MAASFQLVIDCADPGPLARFWAAALGYELEPPPAGFASWDAYWRDVGVPEDELGLGADCIVDPEAARLGALGAEFAGVLDTEGLDHYAVAMKDPEGNEFDIN